MQALGFRVLGLGFRVGPVDGVSAQTGTVNTLLWSF